MTLTGAWTPVESPPADRPDRPGLGEGTGPLVGDSVQQRTNLSAADDVDRTAVSKVGVCCDEPALSSCYLVDTQQVGHDEFEQLDARGGGIVDRLAVLPSGQQCLVDAEQLG